MRRRLVFAVGFVFGCGPAVGDASEGGSGSSTAADTDIGGDSGGTGSGSTGPGDEEAPAEGRCMPDFDTLLWRWTAPDSAPTDAPNGIAVFEGGDLAGVMDDDSIVRWGPAGVERWREAPPQDVEFQSVAIDPEGGVWLGGAGEAATTVVGRREEDGTLELHVPGDQGVNRYPLAVGSIGDRRMLFASSEEAGKRLEVFDRGLALRASRELDELCRTPKIASDELGNAYVACFVGDGPHVAAYDARGDLLWDWNHRDVAGSDTEIAIGDQVYVLVNGAGARGSLFALDYDGQLLWQDTASELGYDTVQSVAPLPCGGAVLGGMSEVLEREQRPALGKIDADGTASAITVLDESVVERRCDPADRLYSRVTSVHVSRTGDIVVRGGSCRGDNGGLAVAWLRAYAPPVAG